MSVLSTLAAATAAVALAVGSLAGASMASASPAAADDGQWGPRLTRACSRIPARIERVERLQTRFHADVRTKGSILFLQARIDKANAEGHADVAKLLSDRMAVRKDIDGSLGDVLTRLKDAQSVCRSHPAGAPSGSSSGSSSSSSSSSATS